MEFRQDPNAKYKAATPVQEQQFDTQYVLRIIFGRILPDSIADYFSDIQNLHIYLRRNFCEKDYLANHPYKGVYTYRTALGYDKTNSYAYLTKADSIRQEAYLS